MFGRLLELAALDRAGGLPVPEAAKALLNVLQQAESRRLAVPAGPYFGASFAGLDALAGPHPDLFVRLRFLFLATVAAAGGEQAAARPASVLHLAGVAAGLSADPAANYQCLVELLRALYNITAVRAAQAGALQERLLGVALAYLQTPGGSPALVRLKTDAALLLLNLADTQLLAARTGDLGAAPVARLLAEALALDREWARLVHMHGVLLVAARLAALHPGLRRDLRRQILPGRWDRAARPDAGDSLKAMLVRALRAPDAPLAQAAGKLLLVLVGDRLCRLVYHVGYGSAAGFLFNHGLMGAYQQELRDLGVAGAGASSDEEELARGGLAGIDPVTGLADAGAPADQMTEAEKEAESLRLLDLFERLERTGVMRVVPQPPP